MWMITPQFDTIDIFSGEVGSAPSLVAGEIEMMTKMDGHSNGGPYYTIRFRTRSGRTYAWHYATREDRDAEMRRIQEMKIDTDVQET